LPVPEARWESVSFDLVTGLVKTGCGSNAVLVLVDHLTKYVHLVPTTDSLAAKGFARLFVRHVFASHGMPKSVVSDRDTVAWDLLAKHLPRSGNLTLDEHRTSPRNGRANRACKPCKRS
jgi:hypothetical protein